MIDVEALEPEECEPPEGWSRETFEAVVGAWVNVMLKVLRDLDHEAAS